MNYVMFGIGETVPHHTMGLVLSVRCPGVGCDYFVFC